MSRPRWLLITHVVNHQTLHRGQSHALIMQAGAKTGDTGLPWVIPKAA